LDLENAADTKLLAVQYARFAGKASNVAAGLSAYGPLRALRRVARLHSSLIQLFSWMEWCAMRVPEFAN